MSHRVASAAKEAAEKAGAEKEAAEKAAAEKEAGAATEQAEADQSAGKGEEAEEAVQQTAKTGEEEAGEETDPKTVEKAEEAPPSTPPPMKVGVEPTDEELEAHVRHLNRTHDWADGVSVKVMRKLLEEKCQVPLGPRKDFIKGIIARIMEEEAAAAAAAEEAEEGGEEIGEETEGGEEVGEETVEEPPPPMKVGVMRKLLEEKCEVPLAPRKDFIKGVIARIMEEEAAAAEEAAEEEGEGEGEGEEGAEEGAEEDDEFLIDDELIDAVIEGLGKDVSRAEARELLVEADGDMGAVAELYFSKQQQKRQHATSTPVIPAKRGR
eukprot:gene51054-63316_t